MYEKPTDSRFTSYKIWNHLKLIWIKKCLTCCAVTFLKSAEQGPYSYNRELYSLNL